MKVVVNTPSSLPGISEGLRVSCTNIIALYKLRKRCQGQVLDPDMKVVHEWDFRHHTACSSRHRLEECVHRTCMAGE